MVSEGQETMELLKHLAGRQKDMAQDESGIVDYYGPTFLLFGALIVIIKLAANK